LNLESVYPNYFATFQVAVTRGRAFTDADRVGTLAVAIVSEEVAAATWPGQDPIGKRIRMGGLSSLEPWLTVVGVAAPTRYRELAKPRPTLYLPAAQFLVTAEMLVLRANASLELVASIARQQIRTIDPDVLVVRVTPLVRMLDRPLARPRFNALLLNIFGVAALLLSAMGLYGLMAAFVRQRDGEIAVRLALGATAGDVRRLILGETVWLAGFGAAIGLPAALGATRILRGMLYEIDPLGPAMLAGAAVVLIAVAALAAWVPMRRAVRVDAVAVLRN
jgi:putative ABC transport system permease protein